VPVGVLAAMTSIAGAGAPLAGRYRLGEPVASGGAGQVWRAVDLVLERPVAVKLLWPEAAGDPEARARFRAEARNTSRLSHPAVAQVYDYGEHGSPSVPFLVMELVDGPSLAEMLASGPLGPGQVVDVIAQVAAGLHAAHSAGLVHCDIKPANLLITADGRVKITDFGIARAVQAAQAGHLTQTGMVMGTAQYVSPEQASGLRVTHASDVYSLGVVAYECLAGAPPFAAEALIALALAHVRDVPPPLPPSVPPLVCDMVMRMLAKRPEDRPASARAVAERAAILRDMLPGTSGPGLAEMAAEDAAWFSEDSPTSPRLHDGATTQIPLDDPQRLPQPPRRPVRRRALVVAAVSVGLLGLGGVTTALMLNDHHAADAGGASSPTPSPHPTRSTHHVVRQNPSQNPPTTSPAIPPPPPSPTASATPSPSASASPTPTTSPTPSTSPTGSPSPTSTTSPPPTSPAAATATVSNP
jgi:eukaryotic-like serine/threonine-protein kinase